MKIALVSDYYQPAIGYAKVKVAQELIKLGHQVKVITSDRYFPFHNYEQTMTSLLGSRIRTVGTKKENGVKVQRQNTFFELFARAGYSGLHRTLDEYKPDHIIVYGVSSFSAVQTASWVKKHSFQGKVVFADSHLPSEFAEGNTVLKQLIYFLFRVLFAKKVTEAGTKFVGLQEDTATVITDIYGVAKPVTIIPNGTDVQLFNFDAKLGQKIRNKHSLPENATVVIYTGKIIPEKGVSILIKAFAKLAQDKNYSKLRCVLVGAGSLEYIESLKKLVPDSIRDKIIFSGPVPQHQLPGYYSASNIAVWPLQESLSMLDAAACQLPFIANTTLGARQRLENDNALLYTKNDHLDLAEKIARLYNDPKLARQMGKRGRELVENTFSWQTLAKKYLE